MLRVGAAVSHVAPAPNFADRGSISRPSDILGAMEISDRLTRLAVLYDKEATKCAKARAYLAACIMQASALEAMLLGMCFLFPAEVKRTATYNKRKRFRRKRSKALDLTFEELIKIADEAGWFPSKRITWGARTNLAGFVHQVQYLRNHVHAGRWAPKHPETLKFTKKAYEVVLEIFEVAHSWLLHHIHQDLRKRLKIETSVGAQAQT